MWVDCLDCHGEGVREMEYGVWIKCLTCNGSGEIESDDYDDYWSDEEDE